MSYVPVVDGVMTLDESSMPEQTVGMALAPLQQVSENTVAKSQLWYPNPEMTQVNTIVAVFHDSVGGPVQGKVKVAISLLGENTFKSPFVTLTPDATEESDIECVEFKRKKSKKKPTILELTFLEPPQDGHLNYPELYFHTTQGVLDPEIVIERDPQ